MKYDLVCFDLDGTLVNSFPFIINSYKKAVIDKYGVLTESDESIIAQIGRPIKYFYPTYPEEDRLQLQNAFSEHNDKSQSGGVPFFDGIVEMLTKLKQITKVGLVTSKRNQPLYKWINQVGFDNLFDVVVGKDDTEVHKPEPDPLLLAIKKANSSIEKTLYVGDAVFDMLCAENAGVDNCLVGWTLSREPILKVCKPKYIAESAQDIIKIAKGETII